MSRDWYENEWLALGYDEAILDRYERRAAGEKVTWLGREKDPTYGYAKDTVIEEFAWDWETGDLLGWKHLVSNSQRCRRKRAAKGAERRDAYEAEAHARDAEVHRLRAGGLPLKEIAATLGMSYSKVQRIAAAPATEQAPAPAKVAPAPVPVRPAAPDAPVLAPVPDLTPRASNRETWAERKQAEAELDAMEARWAAEWIASEGGAEHLRAVADSW